MRIALCDDEQLQRDIFACFIKKYQVFRPNFDISLDVFSSANELLRNIDDNGAYDLYVLDIIMPKTTGIKLAMELRARNCEGLIVYLTVSPDFVMESYQTQAFHYLLKPIKSELLFEVLDRAYASLKTRKTDVIAVKTSEEIKILSIKSILYAELVDRSVEYHLMSGEQVRSVGFRGSFQREVSYLLNKGSFSLAGASFAVNLHHIISIRKTDIMLTSGVSIPVSRNMYTDIKKQWMNYWLDGGNTIDR